jgi:release factor glutamine methyltransferase
MSETVGASHRLAHIPPESLTHILAQARAQLSAAGCDTPGLDAEVLLAQILDRPRSWLHAHPEHHLSPDQIQSYRIMVERRVQREPVAYLTGTRSFYGLDFAVTPDVLIPRPETELLVENGLRLAGAGHEAPRIAELGTGSGAIAVCLALQMSAVRLLAADISAAALDVARRNAARHGVADRVDFLQADLLPARFGTFHMIVSNPPYVSQAELQAAQPEVAVWEPRLALDGGPDGLDVIRRLVTVARQSLRPEGLLLMEIGAGQGQQVRDLARHSWPGVRVEILPDYAGHDRVVILRHLPAPCRM